MTYAERYKDCLDYIDSYWDKIIIKPKTQSYWKKVLLRRVKHRMHKNVLDIPYAFLVPNDKKFAHIFYWDAFFMFKGLIRTRREWILKDMVQNFVYLFRKHGLIPNFNSPASTGRSQPPFFTSMILDTYNVYFYKHLEKKGILKLLSSMRKNNRWLKKMIEAAKEEYWNVWVDQENLFHHRVEGYKLNRYGDRDIGYAHSSELESGWDFTSRFFNRCDQFLPIDLNVYLYKYERDFAKVAFHLKQKEEEEFWWSKAKDRKKEIQKLMWNEKEGFFFDYGYVYKRQSDFLSLAGFTPLWAGVATMDQAKKMVKKLSFFETEHGLTITSKENLIPKINLSKLPKRFVPAIEEVIKPKQWDYPYIWPPLEYLTVIGLLKYGMIKDAARIMKKSLKANAGIFRAYGTFFEKIDGVKGDKPADFHYPSQSGFGWTNAVFYRYVKLLDLIESKKSIYANPKSSQPPYKLSVPH